MGDGDRRARQSRKQGGRQSKILCHWQQSLKQELRSFHQAKFGAQVPPSELHRVWPGKVAQHWSSSKAGVGEDGLSDRPGTLFGLW